MSEPNTNRKMHAPLLLRWLINALALMAIAWLMGDSVEINGFGSALMAAAVIGVLNVFIRPFFILITLPLNIMTLGLFTFVINAVILLLVSSSDPGDWFYIKGFWPALGAALLLSLVSSVMNSFFQPSGNAKVWVRYRSSSRQPGPEQNRPPSGPESQSRPRVDNETIDMHQDESGRWEK